MDETIVENGHMSLKEVFPDVAVLRDSKSSQFFQGRNLPAYVKDYILRRFSNSEGEVQSDKIKDYLNSKMPLDKDNIKGRLLKGDSINLTARVVFKTNIRDGKVEFELPDIGISSDAFVSAKLLDDSDKTIYDGEQWGNMTVNYVAPDKKKKGAIIMTFFKPFEPYKIDLNFYKQSRKKFSLEEWIDSLILIMGYNPKKIDKEETKLEYIARLLPFVEPQLNVIELGPKSTGKSHLYNNLSKRGWCISGGKISRAKLFYNKTTKKFGLLKHYDVVSIDEISSFSFVDPDEMQSAFKSYLEAGKCTVDNINFLSDCGLVLMGNILLDENRNPIDSIFINSLPEMLRESATLDRFHSFIEGWKLPRLEVGLINNEWTLDSEYFSSVLHAMRSEGNYGQIFEEIVDYEQNADLRDLKAVKKTATAFTKLLFPHVVTTQSFTSDALERFKEAYDKYCLQPAINRRAIIRNQCHYIDKEFENKMPQFKIR